MVRGRQNPIANKGLAGFRMPEAIFGVPIERSEDIWYGGYEVVQVGESIRDNLDTHLRYCYGTYYLIGIKQILFTAIAIRDTIECSHNLSFQRCGVARADAGEGEERERSHM